MKASDSARRMAEMIKKAIADHVLTDAEYHQIMAIADEDWKLDPEEKSLLAELHSMIADKTVKRIQG